MSSRARCHTNVRGVAEHVAPAQSAHSNILRTFVWNLSRSGTFVWNLSRSNLSRSRMLAFHGCREDGCFIFVSRSDGSDLRRVTNDEYGGQWPRWSPDGKWIAYTSARDDQTDIWLARPDGSETRRVTDHPGRDEVADWQP